MITRFWFVEIAIFSCEEKKKKKRRKNKESENRISKAAGKRMADTGQNTRGVRKLKKGSIVSVL